MSSRRSAVAFAAVLGTLFLQSCSLEFVFQGWSAKILGTEILAKNRRHAAFQAKAEGQKIW